jgi:hypothetical protein
MGKQKVKPNYRRRSLRLPDLDHCKRAVLNSLGSLASRRVYEYAIDQFIAWYCSEPRLAFNPSTASWLSATACTWNHVVWQQIPSINNSRLCEDSRTKLLTLDCSALNWLPGSVA